MKAVVHVWVTRRKCIRVVSFTASVRSRGTPYPEVVDHNRSYPFLDQPQQTFSRASAISLKYNGTLGTSVRVSAKTTNTYLLAHGANSQTS